MRALVVLLLVSACTRSAPVVDAGEPECTLTTPLRKGVPGSPGHLLASARNPNGASELATLMRRFVDDWTATREALRAGQAVEGARWPVHRHMRCAWPTALEDRNETFDGLAVRYLAEVKRFDEAPSRERYEAVIAACAACHEVTCGGPLAVIETLHLE